MIISLILSSSSKKLSIILTGDALRLRDACPAKSAARHRPQKKKAAGRKPDGFSILLKTAD
ncbi:hypothetical protein [Oxalicibacterium flavum]|uniref:hypothetical protein n=1 Tax=Oxalicibacterium flavum TaxID=179467 RepID=UPI001668BEEB|nr:hypothetical protein [Oxalicibacterium flavum]